MHSVPFQHVYAVPTLHPTHFCCSPISKQSKLTHALQVFSRLSKHTIRIWRSAQCLCLCRRVVQSPEKYNFPLTFIWLHAAVAVYHLIRRLLIFRIRAINWSLIITDDSFVSRFPFATFSFVFYSVTATTWRLLVGLRAMFVACPRNLA